MKSRKHEDCRGAQSITKQLFELAPCISFQPVKEKRRNAEHGKREKKKGGKTLTGSKEGKRRGYKLTLGETIGGKGLTQDHIGAHG